MRYCTLFVIVLASASSPEGPCGPGAPPVCGEPDAGECGCPGPAGCDDCDCCAAVCAVDPFCCDVEWDIICIEEALLLCGAVETGGACCFPDGACDFVFGTGEHCEDLGGRFLGLCTSCAACGPDACFEMIEDEVVCHSDGTTFTYTVSGTDACTGGTSTYSFTASGGAAGEEMCFTLLVNVEGGAFCCATEVCVVIPDCAGAITAGDLDDDGMVGVADILALLAAWGPCADCGGCPADFDGDCAVGTADMLELLANWTA